MAFLTLIRRRKKGKGKKEKRRKKNVFPRIGECPNLGEITGGKKREEGEEKREDHKFTKSSGQGSLFV